MIRTADLIKTIRDYQEAIPLVAFPMNLRVNLHDNEQALNSLSEIVKNANGDEVQVSDYGQLQFLMQAQNLLQTVITLPLADRTKKSKIEAWQREKFKLKEEEPVAIILFEEVLETAAQWQEKERYLTIPRDFYDEAGYIEYYEKLSKLSPEEQQKLQTTYKVLNLLKDPQDLFNRAKKLAGNNLLALIEYVKKKHADKELLLGHVFIDLRHDLDNKDWAMSLWTISSWLAYGIDQRYKLSVPKLDEIIKSVDAAQKSQQQRKAAEAKQKEATEKQQVDSDIKRFKKMEEDLKENDPELKEQRARAAALDETIRQNAIRFEEATHQAELSLNLHKNMDSLISQPSQSDNEHDIEMLTKARDNAVNIVQDLQQLKPNI